MAVKAAYSSDELAYFKESRWVERRAELAPAACDHGTVCWVRDGPPAYGGLRGQKSVCLGCKSPPRNIFRWSL